VHDRNRTLWSGFAFEIDGRRVYFAGDTGHHPEFGVIGERFGPFDALLLPVGAYEPQWFMRPMHMNPEDALNAYTEIDRATTGHSHRATPASGWPLPVTGPVMVPIHWGTFKLTDEPMDEPPKRTQEAWGKAGYPESGLWLLRHGETRLMER
jgi:N-acyl-phosphatidylethanolamine-hydrolysing phospholipase D